MKKQLTALMVLSMLAAPVMAQSLDNQAFEAQVFHNETAQPMQLGELSAQEMKETEGAWIPLAIVGGAAISMWAEHGLSYARTGQPASVRDVTKAGAIGAIPGGVGAVGKVAAPAIGTTKHWARFGNSYSHAAQSKTVAFRWGSNNHYAKQIGNQTARNLNHSLRNTKLPGSSWRVQDKGHFHLWKKK